MLRILALLFALAASAHAEIVGQASVVDADTIEIQGERIRLDAVDAPESDQWCLDASGKGYQCGQDASFALADKIGRKHVRCKVVGHDQYDRILARCFLGEIDLNEWLVLEGHALAYRRYSTAYVSAERSARKKRAGMWQGQFDAPWEWRNGDPTISEGGAAAQLTSQQECRIKGNISSKGERIYHSPGQQHYGRTKIDTSAGERWFCSPSEAEAAGWRAAKQ